MYSRHHGIPEQVFACIFLVFIVLAIFVIIRTLYPSSHLPSIFFLIIDVLVIPKPIKRSRRGRRREGGLWGRGPETRGTCSSSRIDRILCVGERGGRAAATARGTGSFVVASRRR